MSTQSRPKNSSVIEQLLATPRAFSFFQAVRLLERASLFDSRENNKLAVKNSIAGFAPPTTEFLRLKSNASFSFPESEINSISRNANQQNLSQWEMQVNFIGLAGCIGVLPFHYTELILKRLKQKDETLLHFLDLFNHRTASLFYQAATKYQFPIEYERKNLQKSQRKNRDLNSQTLLSLIGLGTSGLENRLQVKDESLIFYSGLFTQKVRTTAGLKQILQDYFAIPVNIQEFIGQWQELIPDICTRLAGKTQPKGQNAQIGVSAMLGKRGWFSQGKIRISLGPLNKEQFYSFAPGTNSLKALNDMVRIYVGIENDYDFVIEVKRKDMPQSVTLSSKEKPIMGWNTWMSNPNKITKNENEILKITVSANRMK